MPPVPRGPRGTFPTEGRTGAILGPRRPGVLRRRRGRDAMTIGDEGLPAELRVPPTTEPTVEADEGAHLLPEAAVIAVTHDEGAASPGDSGTTTSYEALAAAEAAGEHAHRLPAEMRVPPTTETVV